MKWFFLIVFVLTALMLRSQDTAYARKIIDRLCSDAFRGRGYTGKGDRRASAYIASRFQAAGLEKVNRSYYQNFQMSVNTFPSEMEVRYNGKLLRPGIDYLADPSSPSCIFSGNAGFVPLADLNTPGHYTDKGGSAQAAVLDTFTARYFEEAAIAAKNYSADPRRQLLIRLSKDKLTWSSSPRQGKVCIITLRQELFDRDTAAFFEVKIKSRLLFPCHTRNVVGMLRGRQVPDSFIVLTAHYDHLGMMGRHTMFPGANDNASGIAMLLNLAGYFRAHPQPYSILFIAFSGEENGLVGSRYFVDHPLIPLSDIRFLINIDLMGNGAEGVMAVNGSLHGKEFQQLSAINLEKSYLPAVKARGKAANSDHYWFSQAGVPAFFFYLMGPYPHYHDVNDVAEAVPLTHFGNAFMLFRDFIVWLQR